MVSISGFFKNNPNKRMTIKVWLYAAKYRFLIKYKSKSRLEKTWGEQDKETSDVIRPWQYRYAALVSKHVNRVAENTPWESKCLVRALTARKLLQEKEIPCTLYLGVGRDEEKKMVAHAWLRAGKMYVTGGDGSEYATVAKFATDFTDDSEVRTKG